MNQLFDRFLEDAERLCDEDYNDITRVPLEWYQEHLTEENYDEMLDEIRADAALHM